MLKLPIYKLTISDSDQDTGVDFVALVDDPAIERAWQAFSNKKQNFQSSEQRVISGPLMVANLPIYRNDAKMGEHYVVFDKEAINKIIKKFFRNSFNKNVNLMHDGNPVDGVYMFESFIIDSTRGILTPSGYEKLTDGSWFGSFKVDNEMIWNDFIKTGEFKGFSVEGIFKYGQETTMEQETLQKIIDIIQQIN